MLYVNAANIHTGGGRWLLAALIEDIPPTEDVVIYVDRRYPISDTLPTNIRIEGVRADLISRLRADLDLSRRVEAGDTALYFGNLPPIRKNAGKTAVFVQNRYQADYTSLSGFPLRVRLRIWLERIWLRLFCNNADLFVVQTKSMKSVMADTLGIEPEKILVAPFVGPTTPDKKGGKRKAAQSGADKRMDFIFPASGEPHKNHELLVDAWRLLAAEGIRPRLLLTLGDERFRELSARGARDNIDIVNLGSVPRDDLMSHLEKVDALIFPSLLESFGMPLVEARQIGMPVIAAELDYVRDVVVPSEVFNPASAVSVARSVKRFMGIDAGPPPVLGAGEFMAKVSKELAR